MPRGGPRREYPVLTEEELVFFWIKAEIFDEVTCWIWRPNPNDRYATFSVQRDGVTKRYAAHRLAYIVFFGSVDPTLVVDHRCENKRCINPLHLQAVTDGANTLRAESAAGINSRKTHCSQGHHLDGDNLYLTPSGRRNCKTCRRASQQRFIAKKRNRGLHA